MSEPKETNTSEPKVDVVDTKVADSTKTGDVEKVESTEAENGDKKRPIDDEKKHKKKRRRTYDDDLPKEKSEEGEDDDEEGEDDDGEEEVGLDDEEDDLAEIDTTNIITSGRRTRGKVIDFAKAAEKLDNEGQKDEDEEDNEFEEK